MAHPASTQFGLLSGAPRPRTLIGRVFTLLSLYQGRRTLEGLDDALLHDIGLTREQALKESRRPIWDVPASWRV